MPINRSVMPPRLPIDPSAVPPAPMIGDFGAPDIQPSPLDSPMIGTPPSALDSFQMPTSDQMGMPADMLQVAPQSAPEVAEDPKDLIKGNLIHWKGGLPVNLKQKIDGEVLEDVLSAHIRQTLELEIQNQKRLIDKIKKWNKNYKGVRDEKKYPYDGTANTASSMTRSDSDAIYVRCYDGLTNKRRFVLMKPRGVVPDVQKNYIKTLEMAFDHYLRNVMDYKRKIRPIISQAVKTGTGVAKIVYEEKNRTITRFARPEELNDNGVEKFKLEGTGDLAVHETISLFKGPNLYAVPRERFIISADAETVDDAYIAGFEFTLRKPELKLRGKKEIYIKKNVEKVTEHLSGTAKLPITLEQDRTLKGLESRKTEYESPVTLYELWFKYDVNDDGEEDDIVVVFHLDSGTILSCIYNPLFYGYRPFVGWVGNPNDFMFDGEGVCEILESTQDEIDALHNLRLDRLAQINLPIVLVRAGFRIDDFKLTPGKTWVIDEDLEQAIKIITFPDVYHSTFEEEDRLKSDGDRAVGVTPNVLGMSTAERPVAKETMVNMEEANKKFANWITCLRMCALETAYKLLECFAQHQPSYTFTDPESGKTETVDMPLGNIRDLIELDLEVSNEQMSMEVRREKDIIKYQMLSDYMTKLAGMVQAITDPNMNSDFKQFLIEAARIGTRTLNDVMESFDERAPEEVVPDITKVINIEKSLQMSVDLLPPPAPPDMMGGEGAEAEGQPGQGSPAPPAPPSNQGGAPGGPPSM